MNDTPRQPALKPVHSLLVLLFALVGFAAALGAADPSTSAGHRRPRHGSSDMRTSRMTPPPRDRTRPPLA